MMSAVIWIYDSHGQLGAYTGYDKKTDAVTREIIKRRGATDSASLEAYGKIGGTVGGAALCTALGAPEAAGICAILGGIIGGFIGKAIPVARGSTIQDAVAEQWNNYTAPRAKLAGKGILAIKAYLTMRDLAITQGASDSVLTSQGLPPAPVSPRWAPSAARYQWAKSYHDFPNLSDSVKSECSSASDLGIISASSGITCSDYAWLTYYGGNFGPVAAPSDPIDWWAVGRDEVAYYHLKKNGDCEAEKFISKQAGDASYTCPDEPPTVIADRLIKKLNGVVQFQNVPTVPTTTAKAGPSPIVVVGGLAALGALAWFLFA